MRIISGKYKGRQLNGYFIDGTRPTMDRVKESVFSMIQRELKESVCLDLFAGSGNLGFEALSNGAKCCYFVDHNKKAIQVMKENYKKLNVTEECHFLSMDYQAALQYLKDHNVTFDVIFLDPPYQMHILSTILEQLSELLNENGIVICEYEKEDIVTSLSLIKERRYGSKQVRIYKNC